MSSNKNEVFEYLIDQLRQQINKKDVTSFNVSVRISDLDEVKQVIHNLQQHIAGKDDEIRGLKDTLRQQLTNNPYRQQCEDLAHEVQSLKNQLRDMSSQIKELHMSLATATGDVEAYKLIRKGALGPEQSGCRDDAAHVEKSWIEHAGAACPVPDDTVVDIKFRNGKMESNTKALWWSWGPNGGPYEIVAYRVSAQQWNKGDTRECAHDWIIMPGLFLSEGNPNNVPGSELCAKCGKREWGNKEYKPKNDTQECEHEFASITRADQLECLKCGVIKK